MELAEVKALTRSNDITITLSDARAYFQGCPTGWQTLCETHSLNWKDVVRYGMKASQLLALNDFMTDSLVVYIYNHKAGSNGR